MPEFTAEARMVALAGENARRRGDALRLYRPQPWQAEFHRCMAAERIVRGGVRAGKSLCTFAETASFATGLPIFGPDGEQMPMKKTTGLGPKLVWLVGYDQRHIGGTIYRMLFKPGAFSIIRDETTGQWRAYDPDNDFARREERKAAPPLIPTRMIDPKGWAWEFKAERVFSVCRLKDGTEIHAFSSKGEPKQGDPVDWIHIDEDIEYSQHVAEWQSRLADHHGYLLWSAFPHAKNDALVRMSQRAADELKLAKQDIVEFRGTFSGNPYIDGSEKEKQLKRWNEDEARARDQGDFLTDSILVYPSYSAKVHGVGNAGLRPIDEQIRSAGLAAPWHWTHYIWLDPGHSTAAAIVASVPPPELGDHIVVWAEVYLKRASADELARALLSVARGRTFEAFIIDAHAARQTPMGFAGLTIGDNYAAAFQRAGLKSHITGSQFINGTDNIPARVMAVREALAIRYDGTSKLLFVPENLPCTNREFIVYRKQITRQEVTDKPVDANNHAMSAIEYGVSYDPQYVRRETSPMPSRAATVYAEWKRRRDPPDAGQTIYCGPGSISPGNSVEYATI